MPTALCTAILQPIPALRVRQHALHAVAVADGPALSHCRRAPSLPERQRAPDTSTAIATSRRQLLYAVIAAPLLWQAAGAAQAGAGLRFLTTEQQAAVDAALASAAPQAKAPVMLRLAFHDAGPFSKAGGGGANASIQYELSRPENFGLNRGWSVIKAVQGKLKGTAAEGAVGAADLIALAGAHAVAITGGPRIAVPVGRTDAAGPDPEGRMPAETISADALIASFADKGLSVQELVVLAGAHTLGNKGFGEPLIFDNTYFRSLLAKPWLNKNDPMADMIGLPSDRVLPENDQCRPYIEKYAADQQLFFDDFAAAYVKMMGLGAAWSA